ncbi:MAG: CDGSH iron-sulfur domain-containing protein [Sandaracinaceae bacterium]|nr:CDGSH iron-sulfur domain-containing protein [Sandaracinaceae bacterium]
MANAQTPKKHLKTYPGASVDVTWNKPLCIHVGECGRAEGELFTAGHDPWCTPDVSSAEDVVDVVLRCPTGALSYTRKDGAPGETAPAHNRVTVSNHGPLYLTGDLAIGGAPSEDEAPGVRFRAALCRCGLSKNKPFCDNAHEEGGFRDRGAVGKRGELGEPGTGTLTVSRAENGPLLLSGPFSIVASSGRVAFRGQKAALCRCGSSKNKPFCDGAHRSAGFVADGD